MIKIKRLQKEDLKPIMEIRNKWIKYLRQPYALNMQDQERWYLQTGDLYYSIIKKDSTPITNEYIYDLKGAVGLTNIDYINKKGELSLITEDYLIENYAQEGLKHILKVAFDDLNLHKIFITIYSYDNMKIDFFEKNKFLKEFKIRDDVFYQGKYYNHYYYSLLDSEYYDLRNKISNSLIYERGK